MTRSRDERLRTIADGIGLPLDEVPRIGGRYDPVVRRGQDLYVSGQVPRVGDRLAAEGCVGRDLPLARAQEAAKVCAVRLLVLVRQAAGSLDAVETALRLGVYVQCAEDFTQVSEVGDGASAVLYEVLDEAGAHTRTSVGVYRLPKNAPVETDLVVALR